MVKKLTKTRWKMCAAYWQDSRPIFGDQLREITGAREDDLIYVQRIFYDEVGKGGDVVDVWHQIAQFCAEKAGL